MKPQYMLCVSGLIALVLALVLALKPSNQDQGRHAPADSAERLLGHDGGVPEAMTGGAEWSTFRVAIGGQTFEVHVREYPEPVAVSEALRYASKPGGMGTALDAYAYTYTVARHATSLEEAAMPLEDPDEFIQFSRWFGDQHGDENDEAVLARVKEQYQKAEQSTDLLGDAVIGDYYIFLMKHAEWPPMFHICRRTPDGTYRRMRSLPEDKSVGPVLREMRLVNLFPTYKGSWDPQ